MMSTANPQGCAHPVGRSPLHDPTAAWLLGAVLTAAVVANAGAVIVGRNVGLARRVGVAMMTAGLGTLVVLAVAMALAAFF